MKQNDGVSMGNPLAPTLANFFVRNMEMEILKNSISTNGGPTRSAMYARYVDDVFCIFCKDENFEPFVEELNKYHPNLLWETTIINPLGNRRKHLQGISKMLSIESFQEK